jgi:hypothetical protein
MVHLRISLAAYSRRRPVPENLFAVKVDAKVLAIRTHMPSALRVFQMETKPLAQVFVTQPASWPALSRAERDDLGEFFDWEKQEAYWWKTLRPAVIALEPVSPSLWAGRAVERGLLVPVGNDPQIIPNERHLFRTLLSPKGGILREPHGPRVFSDLEVTTTSATRLLDASFPTIGNELVWLKLFRDGFAREAHISALARELAVMDVIAEFEPGLTPRVLHHGKLETGFYSGPYAALEKLPGLSWNEAVIASKKAPFSNSTRLARNIVFDLVRLFSAAHSKGWCIGPLSPGVLRIRLAFLNEQRIGQVTVVSIPGAGTSKTSIAPSLMELLPEGQCEQLMQQFEQPYKRSIRADLRGLGILMDWMISDLCVSDEPLAALANNLRAGTMRSARDAAAHLTRGL